MSIDKKTLYCIVVIVTITIVAAVLALVLLPLAIHSFEFCAITFERFYAIDSASYGWRGSHITAYNEAVSHLAEFSKEGIYQEWLVYSGTRIIGKIVRLIVMLATSLAPFGFVCISIDGIRRLFTGNYQKK